MFLFLFSATTDGPAGPATYDTALEYSGRAGVGVKKNEWDSEAAIAGEQGRGHEWNWKDRWGAGGGWPGEQSKESTWTRAR